VTVITQPLFLFGPNFRLRRLRAKAMTAVARAAIVKAERLLSVAEIKSNRAAVANGEISQSGA
jgi:hypothetical protein